MSHDYRILARIIYDSFHEALEKDDEDYCDDVCASLDPSWLMPNWDSPNVQEGLERVARILFDKIYADNPQNTESQ
jgi:hypothetical protein